MIMENGWSTVVAERPQMYRHQSSDYQSEAALEKAFIEQLQTQGYEYLPIHEEKDLINNLRLQLEKLNDIKFTDNEWHNFYHHVIANPDHHVIEKTTTIQHDNVKLLHRDDGTTNNITIIDKGNRGGSIYRNKLQVINQYEVEDGKHPNRYDVTILVNGLPLVHIELKRRGVELKQAFNQIDRYQRDSFWAGSGLYEYVQLFIISNGTYTKYYSNTTRDQHVNESRQAANGQPKTSSSYEFTSWWSDEQNKTIIDLLDFTATFLSSKTLLNILTRYCVFNVDKQLMVMRPYQIAATEKILNRIQIAHYNKQVGTIKAGGYIWHTTGSGKTLTSFKTAQLASQLDFIDKVLFVVDRKDLDYQTMREYNHFQPGSASASNSTRELAVNLRNTSPDKKVVITTIQKLSNFINHHDASDVFTKNIVMIFDECHRNQFGDMHRDIVKNFKNYYIFGFTGTPIFQKNAINGKYVNLTTTEQAFGDQLHTYTIVNAINDKNVLPFRLDYINTVGKNLANDQDEIRRADFKKMELAPERVSEIVGYIRRNFDHKTSRYGKVYRFNKLHNVGEVISRRDKKERKSIIDTRGFNSIFAVSSIPAAIAYYREFARQQQNVPESARLKIATIFSYGVNEDTDDVNGFMVDENSDSAAGLDASSRDFLDSAIGDYNAMFGTSYDTSSEKFQNYYKDVSMRVKNKEIDILIVVGMFLTGFDAKTLNTLWVDKNLRMHGLIQAFSRTNRILNSVKTFGNIVMFRNLEKETNEALSLFGDKNASGIVLLRTFNEYMNGYRDVDGREQQGYKSMIDQLLTEYPDGRLGDDIQGEESEKDFIKLYGKVLRAQNTLNAFDDFWKVRDEILDPRRQQDYQSTYLLLHDKWTKRDEADAEDVSGDVVFELELVKQVEVNIDYILDLVKKYHDSNTKDKEVLLADINRAVESSVELRKKKELIDEFMRELNVNSDVDADWREFVDRSRRMELDKIIADEHLNPEKTYKYIRKSFRNGDVDYAGRELGDILPPISPFAGHNEYNKKKLHVFELLKNFFDKFFDLVNPE